jgi:predicted DNA-binding transcriptional regulator AlpA
MSSTLAEDDELLRVDGVAALLKKNRQAVYWLNYTGNGPPRYRLDGRTIFYKKSEVLAWIEARRVENSP